MTSATSLVRYVAALALISLLPATSGQSCTDITSGCGQCISSTSNCVWCADESFTGTERCYPNSTRESVSCILEESPQPSSTINNNADFGSIIQLRPQNVSVMLRAGIPQTLDFSMELASNFPLDVYFLMDFSFSMRVDLNELRGITANLSDTIRNITPNFQLGFGSFVDKPTPPYVLGNPTSQLFMCLNAGTCTDPYVFRNHLSLTSDTTAFATALNDSIISSNFDGPESTLDAMAQVISCRSEIGWRLPPARHLLIVITDADFHTAGDGKLGAAIKRNEGTCRLDGSGNYTGAESLQYDYPSVGTIAHLLQMQNIVPIFMITQNPGVVATYQSLIKAFGVGTFSFLLEGASDVTRVIVTTYNNISTVVTMTVDGEPIDGLSVSVRLDCIGGTTPGDTPDQCRNVGVGERIPIEVTLNITECTEQLQNGVVVSISDTFPGSFQINVKGLCSCECEDTTTVNAADCSSNGNKTCGVCVCNPGRYGRTCQCIDENPDDGITPTDTCPRGSNGLECFGRGNCMCGTCECQTNPQNNFTYYGDTCQCDDFSCLNISGQFCNGNGMCLCGSCNCTGGYSGSNCECKPPSGPTCTQPGAASPCSGRGTCDCNMCNCANTGYRGTYCHECNSAETCTASDCDQFTRCVNCEFVVTDNSLARSGGNCSVQCEGITIIQVNSFSEIPSTVQTFQCTSGLRGAQCRVDYYFNLGQEDKELYVVNTLNDCLQIPIWAIAIAIFIAFVILAIILILLIRLIIYILDWKEYKRFQKEVAGTQFGENINPLYHQPETQHQNPLFAGKTPPKEPIKSEDVELSEKKPL